MSVTPVLAQRLSTDRSFERLYRKHAGDVYRYALVVLRNEADAEDVTQTTFLNAYRAMERGERPRQPQNWLISIAHNVCRQRFRQSQRRPNEVFYEEELAEDVVEEDALTADDIRRALGHLAFNQRSALVMRELEGRSYQEIADILETTVSAVETLIFRARRALREQLEEGITCHAAELAISRQLDGRLSRKEKGALRAHLRECEDCAGFARSQRAQRGALKALGAIPLPQSLVGLFGGSGGGAAVGGAIAAKATVFAATAVLATGVGYEGVQHGIHRSANSASAAAAASHAPVKKRQPTKGASARVASTGAHTTAHTTVVTRAQDKKHDQKPFRRAAVTARRAGGQHRHNPKLVVSKPELPGKPLKEVSPLPPSRGRTHDLKPVKPVKTQKPHENSGHNGGSKKPPNPKSQGKKPAPPPPPPPPAEPPATGHGKSTH
jgi:RNA polymerase sigma factor (sigma-70 family)